MLDRVGFAQTLIDVVELSDAIYAAHHGQPAEFSTAAREVAQFDSELEAATGPPAPLFGAYFDAEGKMRTLNDLIRSAATLLVRDDTSVGYVIALRSAMETAARLYWVLAPDRGHLDRAGRFLRERLRSISEVGKFNAEARVAMSVIEAEVFAGADRAGIPVPGSPTAVDLIADLVTRPGVLSVEGIDRGEAAAMFYRLPSAPTHGAVHGVALHYADPRHDPTARRTTRESWEHTLVVGGGLYASYTTTHRALLLLYGWETAGWDHHVRAGLSGSPMHSLPSASDWPTSPSVELVDYESSSSPGHRIDTNLEEEVSELVDQSLIDVGRDSDVPFGRSNRTAPHRRSGALSQTGVIRGPRNGTRHTL